MIRFILLLALIWSAAAVPATAEVIDPALMEVQESIHQALAMVRPSVVSVRAKKRYMPGNKLPAVMWYESIGSGFVVDERGYIVSNYHVVEGASTIEVTVWPAKGESFAATVEHADKALDLVVLKIDAASPLPVVRIADSDLLEIGDWVMGIGSPFGFDHTVTLGTVSAVKRNLFIEGREYKDMIQTDTVINEGNSGGPLVTISGEVVGVSTAIYAPDGTYTGLGFAIPINRAKHFFTMVTGAMTAALNTPAKNKPKVPIDINKKRPGDAIHKEFSDCTECHVIATKSVVSMQVQMPHPMVGPCDVCHILENAPPAGKPVTVAQVRPLAANGPADVDFSELVKKSLPKSALLILVASLLFSMLGLGGGFVYVPILLYCGIDFYTASTTSLLMLTAASASALYIFFRSGLVDWRLVIILEIPTMIAAYVGGMTAEWFNISTLYLMFAITLFVASYFMLQDQEQLWLSKQRLNITRFKYIGEFQDNVYIVDLAIAVPLTLFVGFFGGVLGIAGGWVIVPMMVVLFAIPMRVAVASSSLMVPITGMAGFLGHSTAGHFDPFLTLTLTLIAVIGAQIGARMSIRSEVNLLRVLFSFVLSLVGLWMLYNMYRL